MVISTGFGTGLVWSILGFSKKLNKIVKKIPILTVRGIQLGLALILGWTSILLMLDNWILGLISVAIILLLIKNKKVPSALILFAIGIIFIFIMGKIFLSDITLDFPIINLYIPNMLDLLIGMLIAGIGQLLLTLTNVMIASIALIRDLFPESDLDANTLALNMGMINLFNPFIGGIPLCHGSGGLAAQYAFGARTGGSMILEGILEIILALFFSQSILLLFINFPKAILGAMLIYTAILLGKVSFKDFSTIKFPIILITAILCFIFNILVGFIVGLILYYIFKSKINENNELIN